MSDERRMMLLGMSTTDLVELVLLKGRIEDSLWTQSDKLKEQLDAKDAEIARLRAELEASMDNQCSYHAQVKELEARNAEVYDWRKRIDELVEKFKQSEKELARLRAELDKYRWRNYPEEKPEEAGIYWCEIASAVKIGTKYYDAVYYEGGWGTYAKVYRWTFLPTAPDTEDENG